MAKVNTPEYLHTPQLFAPQPELNKEEIYSIYLKAARVPFNLPITCFKVLGKVNVFLHLNETCNLDITLNSNLTPFTNNSEERAIKACLKEFKLSVGAAPYQLMLDFIIDDIPKSPNLLSLKNARAVFHNLAILNVNNLTATEEAFIDSSIE